MGFQDALNYALFTNPITAGATSYFWSTATTVNDYLRPRPKVEMRIPPTPLWKLAADTGPHMKLAALSGAAAVMLGAYGAHKQYPESEKHDLRQIFETGNRYHFIHTLAMLGLPLCRAPYRTGVLLISGIVLFSGSCYYLAFTGDPQFRRVTPIGGVCLILGWLSFFA